MSTLKKVQTALAANQGIQVVGVRERNYLPERDGYWSHTMDFYVAPKVAEYRAGELQKLMLSLVPEAPFTAKDDFSEGDRLLRFGKLYFDEDIGTENTRTEIVLHDKALAAAMKYEKGRHVIEDSQPIQRRTWVNLFPNIQIAAEAFSGAGMRKYEMDKTELDRYRDAAESAGLSLRSAPLRLVGS